VSLRRAACAAVWASLLGAPAFAGWTSLGAFPAPERSGQSLVFRSEQAVASVTVLAPDVVRVRLAPAKQFGRDHSYAVVAQDLGNPEASFQIGSDQSVVLTKALRVTITHAPFRVAFATAAGESLDEDDKDLGTAFAGERVKVWKRLRDDEHVYGFGEKVGKLDKRGWQLGGYSFTMWNTDTYGYDSSTDPIYASIPFFMVLRGGRAHGIFFDSTWRTTFDVGHESPGLLAMGAVGGELNYYFIDGPAPKRVLERYTALTGRMPMPPRWALGYNQCRYSYYPESKVRFIAQNFRERRIPADVIWLDIHYQKGYRPFSWDPARFPDPKRLVADLRAQGLRTVVILDAHPRKEPGTPVYDSGLAGDFFVKNADGSVYEGPVWPSQAESDPGPSVFPDFSKPGTREWWGGLYSFFTDFGVAGIWNDMNEPAVFSPPTATMPLTVRHDNEGQPTDHREIHNVYGQLMSRATFEGLARLRPRERPFVLTRATYAGGQRYSAVWPGDNVSDWPSLGQGLAVLMGLGLSGFPFVGTDIGGFAETPSAELFTRWLQVGVFHPFMRTHTTFGTPDQEPWSYGTRHEAVNRRAIELRYELLPQIYQAMKEASETGVPALRPLFLEFPEDPQTWGLQDQFLFGRDLLVAPVLREAQTERGVYLPAGDWYDYWTGRLVKGGRPVTVPVTLESIPIYVRAGAIVFTQPVVQHTGEMPGQPLRVSVYPAARSEAELYEDDGESLDYRDGAFARRRFAQRREPGCVAIDAAAATGSWRPAARDLVLRIRSDGEPQRVRLDGAELARASGAGAGFRVSEDGFVEVRLPDKGAAFAVTLEAAGAAQAAGRRTSAPCAPAVATRRSTPPGQVVSAAP
jgi:alpha-glucosidase